MEQDGTAVSQQTDTKMVSGEDSVEKQSDEATGNVCSQEPKPGAESKMSEEAEAQFSRRKLFDKVMQKSLEKFVELARYRVV